MLILGLIEKVVIRKNAVRESVFFIEAMNGSGKVESYGKIAWNDDEPVSWHF